MTLCPIALLVGCRKCPALSICPMKSAVGDYRKPTEPEAKPETDKSPDSAKPAK